MLCDLFLYWAKLPLKQPYHLSFGVIDEFDSFFVVMGNETGLFWGEATALPGYSWESPDDIWNNLVRCIQHSSSNVVKLKNCAEDLVISNPFAATPILTAVEKLLGVISFEQLKPKEKIPLTAIIQGQTLDDLASNVENLLKSGYSTFKAKLTKDVWSDMERVRIIQGLLPSDVKLRLDANQGYDYEMAELFLRNIDTDSIEFFEQPFPKDAWPWNKSLAAWCPVPLMLDESVWTARDIECAARVGADIVKLKLVKHGSILNTINLIEKATQLGLGVVLGNGVQTPFGCADECLVYKTANVKYPGEMNGFLKLKRPLVESVYFKEGYVFLEKDKLFEECADINHLMDNIHKGYSVGMEV